MITYQEFLEDDTLVKNILVEVNHDSTTEYLSSNHYVDTVAGRKYNPIVRGSSVKLIEALGFATLDANISFGDIELENQDGSIDSWLNFVWTNRDINIYIGHPTWNRADYVREFTGVVEGIDSRSANVLNLKLRDKLERLNFPITDLKLGGSTVNADEFQPLTFGEPHNISPLLSNPATLEFQFNQGNSEDVWEVTDNGVPVSITKNLAAGKFTLNQSPFGIITCKPQGDKPGGNYLTRVKTIIERLVTGFGNPDTRFTGADLDTANLNAFDAAHQQNIGIHYKSRQNLLTEIKRIAASVGAQVAMSRDGLMQLHKVDLTTVGTISDTITVEDIVHNSLAIAGVTEIEPSITLRYARNWVVQDDLQSGIPEDHKQYYGREWLTVTKEDTAIKNAHRLDAEPRQVDTYLVNESQSDTEGQRLVDNYKVQRKIVTFTGYPRLFQLQLGSWVNVQYPRFGLDAGEPGIVIGLSPDWANGRIKVDVIIR